MENTKGKVSFIYTKIERSDGAHVTRCIYLYSLHTLERESHSFFMGINYRCCELHLEESAMELSVIGERYGIGKRLLLLQAPMKIGMYIRASFRSMLFL